MSGRQFRLCGVAVDLNEAVLSGMEARRPLPLCPETRFVALEQLDEAFGPMVRAKGPPTPAQTTELLFTLHMAAALGVYAYPAEVDPDMPAWAAYPAGTA